MPRSYWLIYDYRENPQALRYSMWKTKVTVPSTIISQKNILLKNNIKIASKYQIWIL